MVGGSKRALTTQVDIPGDTLLDGGLALRHARWPGGVGRQGNASGGSRRRRKYLKYKTLSSKLTHEGSFPDGIVLRAGDR
ncbi:hypothetical protein CBM2585_B20089 [Cupriavidus taiwanensis]|nr:hypothetical protein CBM2585_B20089 [Cupriavidus taiwanensis]